MCVDGPAGSGKTTFAGRLTDALGDGAGLVHLEDLYAGWTLTGAVARLSAGVLRPLAEGRPGVLPPLRLGGRPLRRRAGRRPGARGAGRRGLRQQPPGLDPWTTLRIWVEAPAPLRLSRGLARDGDDLAAHWRRWQESEARHFAAEDTRARADLRVDGAAAAPADGIRPRSTERGAVRRVSSGHTPGTRTPHHGVVTETEPEAPLLPLAGYTVAVTAARRKEELGALLDRRGARVVYAPAIRIVPLSDDAELVAATREVMARPVDLVIATTGVGFRGWLEAADAWDLPLVEHLRPARVMARGPKARGAIRGGGLVDAWSPESESSAEVLSHLLSGAEGPLEGRRIAVQLHGDPLPDLVAGAAGRRRRGGHRAGLPLGAARGRRPGPAPGRLDRRRHRRRRDVHQRARGGQPADRRRRARPARRRSSRR